MNFCTYFDSKYITFGFSLIDSLNKYINSKFIYILCLDHATLTLTKKFYPEVITITLSEIEIAYQDLLLVKERRPATEYIWTLTPHLIEYLIRYKNLSCVTYLDSDQFFFDTPKTIIHEVQNYSISILPHRFKQSLKHLEVYGFYNVSWVTMKNDSNAINALKWWRIKCIENCTVDLEQGIVGDQKYLDLFKSRFQSVHDINHDGCGVAPWNFDINKKIILYHFQSLRLINRFMFTYNHSEYNFKLSHRIFVNVYAPFIKIVLGKYSQIKNYQNQNNSSKLRFRIHKELFYTNDFIFIYKRFFLIFNFRIIYKLFTILNKLLRH